jgi:fumarate reductase flavoprotein subunit
MAGLCAAARARELGADPVVLEKGDRPGGSMLLSSCVIWRYQTFEDFSRECPGGDERLQRLVFDRFDEALEWLVSLGPEIVWEDTTNPRTTGKRFEPRSLTDALVRAVGEIRLASTPGSDPDPPLVLATGGFPVRYAREHGLLVRSNPWSEGDGLDYALARGAETTAGMDEFYGRAMPAPPARIREEDFVALSQLYGKWAWVHTPTGRVITPPSVSWSENDLAQLIGPSAWFVLNDEGYEAARDRIEGARAAGGTVLEADEIPFETRPDARVAVRVSAAVTHTIGGLNVDGCMRTHAGAQVYACGVDVGGIATGGYASGLAQALVTGLVAAESVASR